MIEMCNLNSCFCRRSEMTWWRSATSTAACRTSTSTKPPPRATSTSSVRTSPQRWPLLMRCTAAGLQVRIPTNIRSATLSLWVVYLTVVLQARWSLPRTFLLSTTTTSSRTQRMAALSSSWGVKINVTGFFSALLSERNVVSSDQRLYSKLSLNLYIVIKLCNISYRLFPHVYNNCLQTHNKLCFVWMKLVLLT